MTFVCLVKNIIYENFTSFSLYQLEYIIIFKRFSQGVAFLYRLLFENYSIVLIWRMNTLLCLIIMRL